MNIKGLVFLGLVLVLIIIGAYFAVYSGEIWREESLQDVDEEIMNEEGLEEDEEGVSQAGAGEVESFSFVLPDNQENLIWIDDRGEVMEEAKEIYRQEISEINEKMIKTAADYANLGVYYSYLGDYKKSYDNYLLALELGESYSNWLSFGDLMVRMRAYRGAEMAYIRAKEILPAEAAVYVKLANLYGVAPFGGASRVRAIFEEGMERAENKEPVMFGYADWLEERGNIEEAILILEALVEMRGGDVVLEDRIREMSND